MRYLLAFHADHPDSTDEAALSAEVVAEMQQLMTDFANALETAGIMVAAEMLAPPAGAAAVTRRSGATVIEDGPFAAAKEALAGVFIIDAADRDAAIAWAERFPGASYGTVEVRAAGASYIDGRWQQP
ncbi:YciI family protein [Brachybacterium sp. JHP9]|uniref:YciI family protein n=1 Tax=Brachybacterium equifaecis TaxID=2910770 RepID=A0ABT0QZ36_9MICO|nr:YciI family protein [Brachybacterium equifaecis]MCL6422923.1 YciI family protein [Brachybacterium equifaecis]